MDNVATTIPPGYWQDAKRNLVPESMVKEIDKLKDKTVKELVAKALKVKADIAEFKASAMADIQALIEISAERYEVKLGGEKGNVSIYCYDGRFKVVRQVAERQAFDEGLQAAKALIDECLREWTEDGRDEVKIIVNDAFNVDKEGKLNSGRILSLRRLDITDERWLKAMKAISDSVLVIDSKSYIRFYERDSNGKYNPIPLDIAAL